MPPVSTSTLKMALAVFAVGAVVLLIATLYWHTSTQWVESAPGVAETSAGAVSEALPIVAQKRIFFGHQSVGANILRGVDLLNDRADPSSRVRIVAVTGNPEIADPAIYHARVGRNGSPASKIAAFEQALVSEGVGRQVDAAMLKFCYADISATTDVGQVFNDYVTAVERIERACPGVTLVHSTVPLRVHSRGIRNTLRTWLLGNPDNIKRSQYNALIRDRFSHGHVFDLAAIEATGSDGTRRAYRHRSTVYHALRAEYSQDGGHLNDLGCQRAADALLRVFQAASRDDVGDA